MGISPFNTKKEPVSYELHNAVSNRMYVLHTAEGRGTSNLEITYDFPDSQVSEQTPNKYQSNSTKEGSASFSTAVPDTSRISSGVISAAAHSENDHVRYIASLEELAKREAI